jgi:PRTRC genetic system protein E
MFIELLPVLEDTTVTLTISRIDDQLLRVNVIPQRRTSKESKAENGLSTPLTITATAEELDRDFALKVRSFSGSYQRSAANIREVEEAHAAAIRAAEEERKNGKAKKSASVPLGKTSSDSGNDGKGTPGGKPVFGSKGQVSAAPITQSLFDTPTGDVDAVKAKQGSPDVSAAVAYTGASPNTSAAALPEQTSNLASPPVPNRIAADGDTSPGPAEGETCHICQGLILPSQARHSVMPFPAHASAADCEAARRQFNNGEVA